MEERLVVVDRDPTFPKTPSLKALIPAADTVETIG
jgi:hypothetical protein